MAITIAVFRAQVDGMVSAKDDELSILRRDRQVKAAIEQYSRDRPDEPIDDVDGDGGKYYDIATELDSWSEQFSRILRIQYPAPDITSDETPVYLDPDDWDDDYWYNGKRYLYLPTHSPAVGEAMRIRYTAPYVWDASTVIETVEQDAHGFAVDDYVYEENDVWVEATSESIATHQVSVVTDTDNFTAKLFEVDLPQGDFFAVCNLAAAFICQAIAAKYSRTTDSSISADSVDHLTRAQEWSRRANEFMKLYLSHMGLDTEGASEYAAGEFVDWDTAPGWPSNRRYLFHGSETR